MAFHVPEKGRLIRGPLASDHTFGNNGAFDVTYKGETFCCIASDGEGWQHVSISIPHKADIPTWDQMCGIKNIFWDKSDAVIQIHPQEKDYVNNHDYCLHLWRNDKVDQNLPRSILVGLK